jgi:Acyl-CoA thioester hydrolase/BAAT N-terminal region
MRLEVSPADALTDEPLSVRLAERPADAPVAVAASAGDEEGSRWRSEARFAAGPGGTLDLGRVAPISARPSRPDGAAVVDETTRRREGSALSHALGRL